MTHGNISKTRPFFHKEENATAVRPSPRLRNLSPNFPGHVIARMDIDVNFSRQQRANLAGSQSNQPGEFARGSEWPLVDRL